MSLQYKQVVYGEHWEQDENYTGIYEVGVFLPASQSLSFVFNLPVSSITEVYRNYYSGTTHKGDNEVSVGNAYLGVSLNPDQYKSKISLNAGFYLPTLTKPRSYLSVFATFTQYPLFFSDYITAHINVGRKFSSSDGTYFALELGADYMSPTGDNENDNISLLNYGIGTGIDGQSMHVGVEFTGAWETSGSNDFSHDSFHEFGVFVEYKTDIIQPALFCSMPTDRTLRRTLDCLVGARLTITP